MDNPSTSADNNDASESNIKFQPIQSGDIPVPVYLKYNPSGFSHMAVRTMGQDCVTREMFMSGPKGVDRIKIAEKMGINACVKSGNRKVSNLIQNVCQGLPNEAGMYQKMIGKFRVHNFYHKSFKPNAFYEKSKEISDEIGRECPFQIGQSIEFPGDTRLTRMRITDVSLKRLLIAIQEIKAKTVVLTRDLAKVISNNEFNEGKEFVIDRRTTQKICFALELAGLAVTHRVKVIEDDTEKECELMLLCSADIIDSTDRRIREGILAAQKQYHSEGRIFPGGQVKKRDAKPVRKVVPPKPVVQPSPVEDENPSVVDTSTFDTNNSVLNLTEHLDQTNGIKPESHEVIELVGTEINYSQKKMIKLHLLHHFLFRLIYHPNFGQSSRISIDDDNRRIEETAQEQMQIYDNSPDSFFRYLSPLPPSDEYIHGWFELGLALRAMPLSIFALIIDTPIDEAFNVYLNDPIRRHTLIYDLPLQLRKLIITKKTILNFDVQCIQLCGLGLLLSAPTTNGVLSGQYSMYYLRKNAVIYDTSIAEKAYALISDSPEKFKRYEQTFNNSKDIQRFWYLLRAISLSTPLNSRKYREAEREKEIVACKKFAKESYSKECFAPPSFEDVDWLTSDLPGRGAALVDPGLFIHLKRHWDMISVKKPYNEWYMNIYNKEGEECRKYVEQRVELLNKFWLSVMQLMVSSGNELLFKKRENILKRPKIESDDETELKRRKLIKISSGKRCLDMEDIESSNKSQSLRNRFSNRERDFMVLMRAVGQFLNPAAKLWIDPQVMRRIMKAYLTESSHKTMLCLLSASCREANNPQRQSDIFHLVRGLGSFTQMRRIRDQLAAVLREDFNSKSEYFCQAFDIAYRLVTCDIPRLPSPLIKDCVFYSILKQNNLTIGDVEPPEYLPMSLAPPKNVSEIQDLLMYIWVLNVLLNESNNTQNLIVPNVLAQHGNEAFYECLEKMLADGVAVRTRADLCPSVKFKNHVAVSVAFCYYFSHIYRADIWETIENLPQEFTNNVVAYSDNFAAFLRTTNCLMDDNAKFEIDIDLEAFPKSSNLDADSGRRNLRDTENSAMRLSAVNFNLDSVYLSKPNVKHVTEAYEPLPTPDVAKIETYASDDTFEFLCEGLLDNERKVARGIVESLKEAGVFGRTLTELKTLCYENFILDEVADSLLKKLEDNFIIFACGIDALRYVHIKHVLNWALNMDGKAVYVKPWSNADGSIDYSTFRWMAEMVFVTINESPDISIENLRNFFANVIHPANLDDILEFFLRSKIIERKVHEVSSVTFSNPFDRTEEVQLETCLCATLNGLEKFGLIFAGIVIPEFARQRQQEELGKVEIEDEEEEGDGQVQLDDNEDGVDYDD